MNATPLHLSRRIFPSQQAGEEIYMVVREHWVHLMLKIFVWVFFAIVLVLFNRYAKEAFPGLFEDRLGQVTDLFTQVYTLFLALSLFLIWIIYYLNIQVVTNLRVVDIDQVGLFSHTISELHIDKIEDVTSHTKGILGTVFNYGDVYVQTAAAKERFEFSNVPNPAAIEKMVLDLYEQTHPSH